MESAHSEESFGESYKKSDKKSIMKKLKSQATSRSAQSSDSVMNQLNKFYDKKQAPTTKKAQKIQELVERNLKGETSTTKSGGKPIMGSQNTEEKESKCGRYQSYKNRLGNHYIHDVKVGEYLKAES